MGLPFWKLNSLAGKRTRPTKKVQELPDETFRNERVRLAMHNSQMVLQHLFARLPEAQMVKIVICRIYPDSTIEFVPPCDSLHPPAEGELRVTLEEQERHHLQIFKDQQWIDLGEVTSKLLQEYDLDPQMSF